MLFNSLEFALFFPLVVGLYFLLPQRNRVLWLLVSSCGFYMAFIPVYILILFVTILIDYFAGIYLERVHGKARTWLLWMSIISTCSVLFVFKYFGFFTSNINGLAGLLGRHPPMPVLKIILPIGLSFHTFQSLSYVVEVYRGRQKAEPHFIPMPPMSCSFRSWWRVRLSDRSTCCISSGSTMRLITSASLPA